MKRPACFSPKAKCPTSCRWCSNSPRPSRHARRASSWPRWRTFSTRSFPRCSNAQAPTPACSARCWSWPGKKPGRFRLRRKSRLTRSGKSRSSSSVVRPRAGPAPTSRNPFILSARNVPPKERKHDHAARFSFWCLSLHLSGSVSARQPDPLRPRTVHVEERLVATAAQRPAALGQQPVPYRYPVTVFWPPAGAVDAARVLRPLPGGAGQAKACDLFGRCLRTDGLDRLVDADLPANVRCAHPLYQPSHRPGDLADPLGTTCRRLDHLAVFLGALRRQRDADPRRLGAAHPHLARGQCRGAGRPALAVSVSHRIRDDDLPAASVQPTGSRVERLCLGRLSVSSLPGRAQPPPVCPP